MIVLIILFVGMIFEIFYNTENLLDADMANEIAYKKMVADTGDLLPEGWYHASELHTNRPMMFFIPIYKLTSNVWLSHKTSLVLGLALQLGVLGYMLKQYAFSKAGILFGMIFYLGYTPIVVAKTLFLYGDAYAGFAIAILLSLGLLQSITNSTHEFFGRTTISSKNAKDYFSALKPGKYKFILKLFLLIAISAYMGFGSPKMVVLLYAPYLLTQIIFYIKKHCDKHVIMFDADFFACATAGILLIINVVTYIVFLSSDALYVSPRTKLASLRQQLSWENLSTHIHALLRALGLSDTERLLSASGIYYLITIVVVMLTILAVIVINKYKFIEKHKMLTFFSIITTGLMFLYLSITHINIEVARYFFVSTIMLGIILAIIFEQSLKSCRWISVLLCSFAIMVTLFPPIIRMSNAPASAPPKSSDIRKCAEYIEDNNYNLASASYWNAGLLRAYSDWTLDVQQCYNFESPQPYKWISDSKVYLSSYKNRIQVLMVTEDEKNACESKGLLENAILLQKIGTMYLFEVPESLFLN